MGQALSTGNEVFLRGEPIPASSILILLENGYSIRDILKKYPHLTRKELIDGLLRVAKQRKDYSLQETLYLLSAEANEDHLSASLEQAHKGEFVPIEGVYEKLGLDAPRD